MARRWALARGLMARQDLGGLVVYGNSGVNRHNHANVFWLSNHLDLHHAYLVAPARSSADAALYVGLLNHVPNARQISETPTVAWGGHDPGETVAGRLRDLGLSGGRVGLVGVNAAFGVGMPYAHYRRLTAVLPEVDFVDVTAEFAALRGVKSKEEIAWLRRAAEFTDRSIAALAADVRPGMREDALLHIIEGAYRPDGGQPHIAFLRSMPMDDPNGCVPAQNLSDRIIARGDVIITEISASYWGYSGQIHRPLFVGADPTPPWRSLFEVASSAYRRLAAAIRHGATERDAVRAASVIGEAGFSIYDDLIHGYGVDIHPPVIDRRCASYWPWEESRPPPEGRRFEANMAIVIQPNPITPDERMGLQLGALTLVTADGAESLHRVPFEPIIVRV
jgi:Xaa-Pro aminopeptidase